MSIIEHNEDVFRAAYQKAWASVVADNSLTPDEKTNCPRQLREYIQGLIDSGETDSEKAASQALGMIRQYEQILRSQARVDTGNGDMTGITPV